MFCTRAVARPRISDASAKTRGWQRSSPQAETGGLGAAPGSAASAPVSGKVMEATGRTAGIGREEGPFRDGPPRLPLRGESETDLSPGLGLGLAGY